MAGDAVTMWLQWLVTRVTIRPAMFSSPLFRFLDPSQNPLGFDAVDFLMAGLAILLAGIMLTRAQLLSLANRLAGRTRRSMAILFALPIVLRLALLGSHPVPIPRVSDDFSYVLLGDTLAHFRLANAMHPMHRFFESVFILQQPHYASIYPLGQGLALAFGQLVFHLPWAGVAISVGLLCALCYWMLLGWVSPPWALLGGVLAAIEIGPLSSWMNTYWGGAVSGIAGCLVFGALPRLKHEFRRRDAVLLGVGLALQLLTRPFEFLLLAAVVLLYFLPVRSLLIAGAVVLPALGLTLLQNKEVTGAWTTLPYQLSRYQYGIPTTFTFQANPVPHQPLTPEQQIDYDAQKDVHHFASGSYLAQLGRRVRFYRFFFLAPLYLAIPAFLLRLKQYRFAWVAIAVALFWLGDAFYPYFYPHYIAAETCLFLLVSVASLELLSRFSRQAVTFILAICLAHFLFWYGVHLSGNGNLLLALAPEETWDTIDAYSASYADLTGRIAIQQRLASEQGKLLVFVHYSPGRTGREWIGNGADIDAQRIVWALDLGAAEDAALRHYYPDRAAWLLEPDARPPALSVMK